MDNKKLNGWNDNRSPFAGVGGKESFDFDKEYEDFKKKACEERGITLQTFWVVMYPESKEVLAMFKEKSWAEEWKDKYSRTSIIESFDLAVK